MWIEIVSGVGIGMWVSLAGFLLLWVYAKKNNLLPEQDTVRIREQMLVLTDRITSAEERLDVDSVTIDNLTKSRIEMEARMNVIESVVDTPTEEPPSGEETAIVEAEQKTERHLVREAIKAFVDQGSVTSEEFVRGFEEWKKATGRDRE